jgi:hypothetical protein
MTAADHTEISRVLFSACLAIGCLDLLIWQAGDALALILDHHASPLQPARAPEGRHPLPAVAPFPSPPLTVELS